MGGVQGRLQDCERHGSSVSHDSDVSLSTAYGTEFSSSPPFSRRFNRSRCSITSSEDTTDDKPLRGCRPMPLQPLNRVPPHREGPPPPTPPFQPHPHGLAPPPPPPPGFGVSASNQRQTTPNRPQTPNHDLGYHTLISRSGQSQWNNDMKSGSFSTLSNTTSISRHSPARQMPSIPPSSVDSSDTEGFMTTNSSPYKGKKWGRGSGFDRLPDDVVLKIFSNMSSTQLCNMARVNRRFYALAWEPQLWTRINLSGEQLNADKALKTLTRILGRASPPFCPTIEKVALNGCSRLTDRGLHVLARRCPELKHLEIKGSALVTNSGIFELVSKCLNLVHLDVTGCSQITCIDGAPSHSNLPSTSRGLGLHSDPSHYPRPQLFLQIQYLDLTDCLGLQDAGLLVVVRNCTQLQCLYLRRCVHITDAGIKNVVSYCQGLREFSVSDCLQITDRGLFELAKLGPSLRYLSIAKCDQVTDAGLKHIARHCYKLRYLNMRGCETVTDSSLEALARSCSRLRALDIGKCDITDAGLRHLAENCPNLKKLSVKSCELVSDTGVQAIAYYCRGLQQLNIQDCIISIDGYRTVKKFCKRCIIEHTNPGFY
ncbi:F-box/LRR-repeat protein 7-like isoform X1 [Artemia franciscana]|uniref:F-box domain-containing protein n=1 Tax=Artemia franciscana TaxID=6661 RepID=A0AA88LF63_ARTSF|nr:hypothetical protein QYM36_004966 [Artemia franciscana]